MDSSEAPEGFAWPLRQLPSVLLAGRYPFFEQRHRHPFVHHGCHAMHLYEYAGGFRCAGRSYVIEPGSLAFSGMDVPTSYHLPRPGHHWCCHFLPARSDGGARLELPALSVLGEDAGYARERLVRLALLAERSRGADADHPAAAGAGAVLLELMCWLADRAARAVVLPRRSDQAVDRVAERIRTRPEEDLRIIELARWAGLTQNWLSARFRARFGMTMARYRLEQRIIRARLLLERTGQGVGAVARQVGIPDPHHFNKLFRRIAGVPPSVCRQRLDRTNGG